MTPNAPRILLKSQSPNHNICWHRGQFAARMIIALHYTSDVTTRAVVIAVTAPYILITKLSKDIFAITLLPDITVTSHLCWHHCYSTAHSADITHSADINTRFATSSRPHHTFCLHRISTTHVANIAATAPHRNSASVATASHIPFTSPPQPTFFRHSRHSSAHFADKALTMPDSCLYVACL